MIADFAKPIADARGAGKRPDAMVIVSDGDMGLHRRFPANPVVRVRQEQRPGALDWRWVAGLNVEIATEDDGARLFALVDAIDAARPAYLRVWRPSTDRMMRVRWLGRRMLWPEAEELCG